MVVLYVQGMRNVLGGFDILRHFTIYFSQLIAHIIINNYLLFRIIIPKSFGTWSISSERVQLQRNIFITKCCYRYIRRIQPTRCDVSVRLAADSSNGLTNTWRCMHSFEFMVMDGKTVWNM